MSEAFRPQDGLVLRNDPSGQITSSFRLLQHDVIRTIADVIDLYSIKTNTYKMLEFCLFLARVAAMPLNSGNFTSARVGRETCEGGVWWHHTT